MERTISSGPNPFKSFLRLTRKDLPNINAPKYEDWLASNYGVITWLVNIMEPEISKSVVMLSTVKKIWDTLKATYAHEKNIARVAKLYNQFFALQQGD